MRGILLAVLATCAAVRAADPPDDWAYRTVSRPAVPMDAAHPVDAFLRNRLKAVGFAYAAPAPRAMLLRRVTFDLTGLPPTPEELDAFAKDESPQAYEAVVDRLLESPRFGEHVATWWLDLVRFAETDGFKADEFRPNAWRYRDYVIASFNEDKPYDRFIREQLAGDELSPDDPAAIVATGFLRHFPDEFNAVNLEQRRQEILNDITDTTAAAFLGITLGCAKCHDHKTDPLAQGDYYRFQAFFAGIWPVERPLATPEALAAHDAKQRRWEADTAAIRKRMAELEAPIREKGAKKERSRFDSDYANLIDIPFANRSPWQKQIAALVERQVYSARKFSPTQLKGEAKAEWDTLAGRLAEHQRNKPAALPTAMAMTDVGPVAPPHHILKRGNWRNPGEEVDPGFIASIGHRVAAPKATSTTTGRRRELADWIANPDHPLTARVMVNRIWQQIFGRGLVATGSDFGLTGEKPTHPELLDWLARDFVDHNWHIKRVYRILVTSAAYRQTSLTANGVEVDPENRWLARAPRKRLKGESLRDAMLAVAGTLNHATGGPSVFPELPAELAAPTRWTVSRQAGDRNRRSIYVCVKRNLRYPLFTLFDAPDRNETCARRFTTTTAPQALALVNDAIVLNIARDFAKRLREDSGEDRPALLNRAFRLAFARAPTATERRTLESFLERHSGTSDEALVDLCHAVLNLNEFLYVD